MFRESVKGQMKLPHYLAEKILRFDSQYILRKRRTRLNVMYARERGACSCVKIALPRLRETRSKYCASFLAGLLHHRLPPPGVHAQEVGAQQQAALRRQAVQPRPQEGAQRAAGVGIPALSGRCRKGDHDLHLHSYYLDRYLSEPARKEKQLC